MAYNSSLKTKQCLRDSYAKKILSGEKEYRGMKRSPLQSYTSLSSNRSLRNSYAMKIHTGEKKKYQAKRKSSTPKARLTSIFSENLCRCHITGDTNNIHIHHVFGASNRSNSEEYGFVVPLRADWHDMADYGIHFNRSLDLRYKTACEEYWIENIGTKEEFIAIFGKWW